MQLVKEFRCKNGDGTTIANVKVAPFNHEEKIVITITKNGKKLDTLNMKGSAERDSFDNIEWFFTKYRLGCYQAVRSWWLEVAYPNIQNATSQRNRTTIPSKR